MKIQEAMEFLRKRIGHAPDCTEDEALDTLITFTEKVLGEPSEAMVEATITSFNDNGKLAIVSHAKSYINQARKEVEGFD